MQQSCVDLGPPGYDTTYGWGLVNAYNAVVLALGHTPATLTVTSTADSGPGTLRAALASAANGDTIDASGVSGTILLTSGELPVSNSVTILGPGPANLAVNGNAASRAFNISGTAVTIAGLTIDVDGAAAPAARVAGRIAAEGAVADGQRRAAIYSVVENTAAAVDDRIAVEGAGTHSQDRVVAEDAAAEAGRVDAEGAVADGQRAGAGVNAAAGIRGETARGIAVGNGQAGDGDERARDVERAAGGVPVHSQISRAGTEDGHVVADQQRAAGQQDGAGDAWAKGNRLRIGSVRERVAQRAGPAILSIVHCVGAR